jgi:hypothetical protein
MLPITVYARTYTFCGRSGDTHPLRRYSGVGEAIHRILPMLSEDEQNCARHPSDGEGIRLSVKSTSGLDIARALIDFVGTFVCPRIIHSDRGRQFLNDMITSLVTDSGLFRIQVQVLETALAVQLAQDAQHLGSDPVEIREVDYVLFWYPYTKDSKLRNA